MNEYDIKRLAQVLSIQAEIEGFKAANERCKIYGNEPEYHQGFFQEKAELLNQLSNKHNEQL
jgi:hypothetical protein